MILGEFSSSHVADEVRLRGFFFRREVLYNYNLKRKIATDGRTEHILNPLFTAYLLESMQLD